VSKKRNQMFHHLLKLMAVYDFVVVVGCGLLYSLPKLAIFSPYSQLVFPVILPWLLPIVQVPWASFVHAIAKNVDKKPECDRLVVFRSKKVVRFTKT
jgi:hypothetical protein